MYQKVQKIHQTLHTLFSHPSNLMKINFLALTSSFMCL